jgi:hypothetical protein
MKTISSVICATIMATGVIAATSPADARAVHRTYAGHHGGFSIPYIGSLRRLAIPYSGQIPYLGSRGLGGLGGSFGGWGFGGGRDSFQSQGAYD